MKIKRNHILGIVFIFSITTIIIILSSCENKPRQKNSNIEECLREVLYNLPISKDGKYLAHHWDARTGKWNENIRFAPMDLPEDGCIVLDIGGSTDAADTNKLLGMYPQCKFHIFEPVPPFFENLKKVYQNPVFDNRVFLHNVGLGKDNTIVKLPKSEIKGQSTFLDGKQRVGNRNFYDIEIRRMDTILSELELNEVSLLHMNCEGCEWDTLLSMGDIFKVFKIVQFSSHNYGEEGIGVRSWQLCQIRDYLNRTHTIGSDEVPFGWERWVRD